LYKSIIAVIEKRQKTGKKANYGHDNCLFKRKNNRFQRGRVGLHARTAPGPRRQGETKMLTGWGFFPNSGRKTDNRPAQGISARLQAN